MFFFLFLSEKFCGDWTPNPDFFGINFVNTFPMQESKRMNPYIRYIHRTYSFLQKNPFLNTGEYRNVSLPFNVFVTI